MKKILFAASALAIITAIAGFLLWNQPQPCRDGCNVIVVMVDTLSAKHLATFGYDRDTMPKTTAFFEKDTVIFEHANSNAPWTMPSFTSMYFSDLASRVTFAELENKTRPTLQSELRNNGVTIKATKQPMPLFIFDAITRPYTPDELIQLKERAGAFPEAKKELEKLAVKKEPFFLLVHTFQAHDPYTPTPPYNEAFGTSELYPKVMMSDLIFEPTGPAMSVEKAKIFKLRYDQQLLELDEELSTFLTTARELSPENTVIILAADHGEAFGEHQYLFHGITLYDEELHIPLMIQVPGIQSRRVTTPVSLLDIAPTILSLAGIEIPHSFKGENLLPLMRGGTLPERVIPFVSGASFFMSSLQDKDFLNTLPRTLEEAGALGVEKRLIEPDNIGFRSGFQKVFIKHEPPAAPETFWFDLSQDPKEQKNLVLERTEISPFLKSELEKLSAELNK
jgi:arylsulfatase A-like enzyme